jgi:hypothetical protein
LTASIDDLRQSEGVGGIGAASVLAMIMNPSSPSPGLAARVLRALALLRPARTVRPMRGEDVRLDAQRRWFWRR